MADAGYVDAEGTLDTAGQTDTGGTTSCALGQFQAPERLTGLGPSGSNLYGPSLSTDGRILYFSARHSSNGSGEDIYTAARTDGSVRLSSVTALDSVNTPYDDGTPSISADGLTLYFYSTRPGGSGGRDIWMTTRATIQGRFGGEKPLAALNSPEDDHLPWVSADELTILFSSTRSGNPDLYISTRSSKSEEFSNPAVLGGVNGTNSRADRAVLSRDGLTIYFISNRAGTLGDLDIWMATRSSSDVIFSGITNLKVLNTANTDIDVDLSADETELFFSSNRAGQYDLYRSVRKCK
jgi:Tol biopolymer transport system component